MERISKIAAITEAIKRLLLQVEGIGNIGVAPIIPRTRKDFEIAFEKVESEDLFAQRRTINAWIITFTGMEEARDLFGVRAPSGHIFLGFSFLLIGYFSSAEEAKESLEKVFFHLLPHRTLEGTCFERSPLRVERFDTGVVGPFPHLWNATITFTAWVIEKVDIR